MFNKSVILFFSEFIIIVIRILFNYMYSKYDIYICIYNNTYTTHQSEIMPFKWRIIQNNNDNNKNR